MYQYGTAGVMRYFREVLEPELITAGRTAGVWNPKTLGNLYQSWERELYEEDTQQSKNQSMVFEAVWPNAWTKYNPLLISGLEK